MTALTSATHMDARPSGTRIAGIGVWDLACSLPFNESGKEKLRRLRTAVDEGLFAKTSSPEDIAKAYRASANAKSCVLWVGGVDGVQHPMNETTSPVESVAALAELLGTDLVRFKNVSHVPSTMDQGYPAFRDAVRAWIRSLPAPPNPLDQGEHSPKSATAG